MIREWTVSKAVDSDSTSPPPPPVVLADSPHHIAADSSAGAPADPRCAMARPAATHADGGLLDKILSIVREEKLVGGMSESKKVVEFETPEDLQKILQLDIRKEGRSPQEIEEIMKTVVRYSVKTQHPHFFNQMYRGLDEVALASTWLCEALNTNQHTFEAAPVFILVEHFVIARLVELFGWNEGDGLFSPGGSMSNMYGMMLARYRRNPEVKTRGMTSMKPLVLFTSDQCHYSYAKAASLMGLGLDYVVKVETDSWGRMIPQALKEAVAAARAKGGEPFFVGATAGSTVMGSFDPLDQLADICRDENLWLHCDACWGGTAILSKKYRHLLHGIDRCDSLSWNPHKMVGAPLQCSPFIVRYKGLLQECNSASASYLFQQDKFYNVSYDTGDKSFQCGRKADAFKLYFLLTCHGLDEVEARVDNAFGVAEYLAKQVSQRPGFRLVLEGAQCTNVCFWYIPPSLRQEEESPEWWNKLGKVAPRLKERLMRAGTFLVAYQPLPDKGIVNFFRMVTTSFPKPTHQQMDLLLDEMERLGADL